MGSSLAETSTSGRAQGVGPYSDLNYRSGSDIESDNAHYDRTTQRSLQNAVPGLSDSATDAEVMAERMREAGVGGEMIPMGSRLQMSAGSTEDPRVLALQSRIARLSAIQKQLRALDAKSDSANTDRLNRESLIRETVTPITSPVDVLEEARTETQASYSNMQEQAVLQGDALTYVGATFGGLAADVGYDFAAGARSVYGLFTDSQARSRAAQTVGYVMANPGVLADAAVTSVRNFAAMPFEQQAQSLFKGGLSMLATAPLGLVRGPGAAGSGLAVQAETAALQRIGKNALVSPGSAERFVQLQVRAEANALRRLKEMEAANPSAHYLEKHGAQLDLQSQFDRAAYGLNPTTAVQQGIPSAATRFLSHRDQLNVINRAESIYRMTGDADLARVPIQFQSIIGSGFERGSLNYGVQYSGQIYINRSTGKAITAFPVWGR